MFLETVVLCVVILLLIGYFKGKWNEKFWNKQGIKFHSRNKLFGPFWDYYTQDRAFFEIIRDIHREHKEEAVVGIGSALSPMLYVLDPQLVRHVFQTDFQSFYHRGMQAQPGDILANNITLMNGNQWKLVRQTITPVFTSSKLKNMYYIIDKSAQDFIDYLDNNVEKFNDDAYDIISTFCNAAVSASLFGITSESIFNSPFLDMAQKALKPKLINDIRFAILVISPWLFRKLGLALFGDYEDFFINAMKKALRQREYNSGKTHDFVDMCVSLQKSGELKDLDTGLVLDPTDELLAAQGFFFYVAGVEPSATTLFSTLFELGLNPHILNRLHKEIDEIFEKHEDQISYDVINGMHYLDMVLNESMRKYPPISILMRQCTQDTILPLVNVKIKKGTKLLISVYELHHDPKRYPDPEKFIPERFVSKEADKYYMPFGKGNRTCIGERFARIQVKTFLTYLLRHFTVKTIVDGNKITFKKWQFQVRPGNVDIKFIKRENVNQY